MSLVFKFAKFLFTFAIDPSLSAKLLLRTILVQAPLFGYFPLQQPLFLLFLPFQHPVLGYQAASRNIHFQFANSLPCHPIRNIC